MTQPKTFDSVFEETIGVKLVDMKPEDHLIDDAGATEEQVQAMFDGFADVLMPLVSERDKHWELMRAGMETEAEPLEAGKLEGLNVAAGGPWTKQRVSALLAVWQHELPGDNGSG